MISSTFSAWLPRLAWFGWVLAAGLLFGIAFKEPAGVVGRSVIRKAARVGESGALVDVEAFRGGKGNSDTRILLARMDQITAAGYPRRELNLDFRTVFLVPMAWALAFASAAGGNGAKRWLAMAFACMFQGGVSLGYVLACVSRELAVLGGRTDLYAEVASTVLAAGLGFPLPLLAGLGGWVCQSGVRLLCNKGVTAYMC